MEPLVEKHDKRDMKKPKEPYDRVSSVSVAQWGIPDICPCGGFIMQDTSPVPKYKRDFSDTLPGSRYFTCEKYKDDGLHFRQPWVFGVEEEVGMLKRKVESMAEEIAKLKAWLTAGPSGP